MKKILFSLILVAVLTVSLVLIFGTKGLQFKAMAAARAEVQPPPETVSTFVVEEQVWQQKLRAVGSVEPIQGVLLEAEIAGIIQSINFENGQEVDQGDLLVQLDVSVEQAELKAAQALARLAEVELERAERLRKNGNVPQSDLDRAIADEEKTKADVESIKQQIQRKTIVAPFTGTVGIRQVNLGQYVSQGAPIVALQANERVYVNFSLPQQALSRLSEGLRVLLKSDAYTDREFEGTITAISPEVDPLTRSIQIQGTLDNPEGLLRAGLFVEVEVRLADEQSVIVVPATAVLYAPYGNTVYTIEHSEAGSVARQQFISIGSRNGDYVSIQKGVSLGDEVVSAGAFKLRNGSSVSINNALQPQAELDPKPGNS